MKFTQVSFILWLVTLLVYSTSTSYVATLRQDWANRGTDTLEIMTDTPHEEIRIGDFHAWIVNDTDSANRLSRDGRIRAVEEDSEVHIAYISAFVDTRNVPWHLDRISHRSLKVRKPLTYVRVPEHTTGKSDSVVYILDTGVQRDHPEFGGRVVDSVSFSGGNGEDRNGHGTHVAGLAGSRTYGSSKDTHIVNVQVLNEQGTGLWSNVLRGLAWAVAHFKNSTYERGVVSASLGGGLMRAINDGFEAAVRQGLVAVVAAGNEGRDACEVSPSSANLAITVGSVDQNNRISEFSNYGKCVDIYAPGERILSTLHGGRTATMSGTSMAGPLVAGVIAMNVYHGQNYSWIDKRIKAQAGKVVSASGEALPLNGEHTPKINNSPYLVLFNGVCTGCGDVFVN